MVAQSLIQSSFNTGELAPALNARVDMQKYHSAAALLRNFFVDYRGGASTRPGTQYILQAYKSATAVRLIPFQASFQVSYVLEFGDKYVRFFNNKAPVLETPIAVSNATLTNPATITVPGNNYAVGNWIFVSGITGTTQLNGSYYSVRGVAGNVVSLNDLNGNAIDATGYTAYVSGGGAARVYTVVTPYAAADLNLLKFAQNINTLILCHPGYPPQALTLITANNWTLLPINFGTQAVIPTGVTATTTLGAGSVNYSYIVTSVDSLGEESGSSTPAILTNIADLRTTAGSNTISWTAVPSATSYNVYKSDVAYGGVVPAGVPYGFIGNATGVKIVDSNITADFSTTPPVFQNPFQGAGIASVAVTTPGTYTTVPSVIFGGASSQTVASAAAVLQVQGTPTIGVGGTGYVVGDQVSFTNGVTLVVATINSGTGAVLTYAPITTAPSIPGAVTSGTTPPNPVTQNSTTGIGTGATANLVWGVGIVQLLNGGAGYTTTPTITFSPIGAAATATLASSSNGYPSVPGFFQQRLVLAAQLGAPQTLNFSQPGAYYNFNISNPIQPDDAISGTLASGQLNSIKSMVPSAAGLIVLTDKASWLVNGGSAGSAISPSGIVANAQSFNGASDVPPIVSNYDILYVQAKGSIVRDSSYNFYANVFTGTDISVLSSHLFYGFSILEWAWAEEPFKVVWAVRNDGTMLTLTFQKEQEFVGWAHSDTNGLFKSVATVVEQTTSGSVDAIYTVVERVINGNTVKYIERIAQRFFGADVANAWCVDAGLQYSGAPQTVFSGAGHLAGQTVTGLADGVAITPFVMPATGVFTLPTAASLVTVGEGFSAQLQTLALDTGDPTIQGKMKKVSGVTVRVEDTLGLQMGSTFSNLVQMKDLALGNVGSMTNQGVTNLVTGDARTFLDPSYTVPGQYCIQQSMPYPATILGVIPELSVGDTR